MESKILIRYKKKSTPILKKLAEYHFNRYIRKRDEGKGCVSCGSPTFTDAGHFYSAGQYPALKFNEQNVHGQCKKCNYFEHGNLNEYRKRIVDRIGEQGLQELDNLVLIYKRNPFKWDRLELINIIEKYK